MPLRQTGGLGRPVFEKTLPGEERGGYKFPYVLQGEGGGDRRETQPYRSRLLLFLRERKKKRGGISLIRPVGGVVTLHIEIFHVGGSRREEKEDVSTYIRSSFKGKEMAIAFQEGGERVFLEPLSSSL